MALVLSCSALASASPRNLECTGTWSWMKTKSTITAKVASNERILDVTDSSGKVEKNDLVADPNYRPTKYKGFNRFSYRVNENDVIGESWCDLILPENVAERTNSFKAYNVCKADQGGGTLRLTCKFVK